MKKGQVTIRDIASKLKISVSTVSRALRGFPEINEETKKAVEEMAKQLKYEPNMIAKSLRNRKTNTLGIIVPDLVTHFFSSTIGGIQDVASKKGYNVMICQSNESYLTEISNTQTLANSQVDGILMSLSKETNSFHHLQSLIEKDIPVVFFDRICEEIHTSNVIVDDHDGAFKAVEHMIEMGYKRIAHISGPENLFISKNRKQGYIDALVKHKIPVDESLIIHNDMSEKEAIVATNALLNLPNPPDAIFSINDIIAIQAMLVIKDRGLKIPEDVGVVGFTNDPVSRFIEPSLTTVAQPAYEIGKISAKLLLDRLLNPEGFIAQSIVLKTELIIRNSSKKMQK